MITIKITGPAGSGKTTLGNKIRGLLQEQGANFLFSDEFSPRHRSGQVEEVRRFIRAAGEHDVLVLVGEGV